MGNCDVPSTRTGPHIAFFVDGLPNAVVEGTEATKPTARTMPTARRDFKVDTLTTRVNNTAQPKYRDNGRLQLHLALLAVGFALASCGPGGERASELTTNRGALQLLSESDVVAQPPGSPQQAVIHWWRLLQYRNAKDSLEAFRSDVRPRLEDAGYDELLFRDLGPWIARTSPHIVSTETRGGRAVVYLKLRVRDPVGLELVRRSEEFVALALDRRGGTWYLADPTFFLQQAKAARGAP